jgi:enoyl-CoA hydratase/carnithine racemase
MSTANDLGEVRTERDGHVFTITIDRVAKLNAFTPEMFDALSDALTLLDGDPDLWAGVITFAGPHTTAGLDLPRFAAAFSGQGSAAEPDTRVDAFALRRRCRKPVVMAVQGITFTIGIEMLLAADIVVAADDCRFCQMEPKRGLAVFGGAHVRYVERAGWGNAMYHLLRADEFGAARESTETRDVGRRGTRRHDRQRQRRDRADDDFGPARTGCPLKPINRRSV